jgi:hypothetical protein
MLILWITRKYREQPPAVDSGAEAFRKHNEAVKKFRDAHAGLNTASARDIIMEDGNLLAPVLGVEPDHKTQN